MTHMVRRIAITSLLLLVTACVAGGVVISLRPPVFTSFNDAIAYDLQQRGVPYRTIMINHTWPDTVNDQRYGAQLMVELNDRSMAHGRLECRQQKRGCYFSLTEVGIRRQELPELGVERPWPWMVWWEDITARWR